MTVAVQKNLGGELRTLRKGRGLFVGQVGERVGPTLRQTCGIEDDDGPAEIRVKVAQWLEKLGAQLPEELRIGVMGAFGIDPDARLPFYQDRVRWIAVRIRRDERTARRRIDEAIDHLVELAAAEVRDRSLDRIGSVAAGWHTEELRVSAVLDRPSPEAIEFRRIVADSDGIDELNLALTVSASGEHGASPDDLSVDLFHGGTLVQRRLESTTRTAFALRLPRPLSIGQTHELMIRFQVAAGRETQPHYVCVPRHRIELFDLHVRFDLERVPSTVQRVAGLFQRDVTDPVAAGEPVWLDAAGEVHATFRQLTPGMAYGLRWQF